MIDSNSDGFSVPGPPTFLWHVKSILVVLLLLLPSREAWARSLDLPVPGYGVSIGNSIRFTGLRINAIDDGVERVRGINATLWNPGRNPDATYDGLALGLIGTRGRRVRGIALSGIGVTAREHVGGVACGGLGVGAETLNGLAAGLIMVDVKRRTRGIMVAGVWGGQCEQLDGGVLAVGGAVADNVRGIAIGGLGAAGARSLTGVALSSGGFYSARFRGIGIGGVGGGGEDLRGLFAGGLFIIGGNIDGLAVSLGGVGGRSVDGIALGGLGVGAAERIRGIAFGTTLVVAPEVTGLAVGAFNGLYVDRIDLEDFLHFNLANRRFTGLSIGLINYTSRLHGVQLGLFNYAGNNPSWLRLLPLINVHL